MKHNAWLVALSFIPFTILGFVFATVTTRGKAEPIPVSQTMQNQNLEQSNILYIVVDKNSKPNPRLISIWGMFFSTLNQPMAEFVPLYPSAKPLSDTLLMSEFVLDENSRLNPDFMNLMKKYFQIDWNGYVMLDRKIESELTSHLGSMVDTEVSNSPLSNIADGSSQFFSSLCTALKDQASNADELGLLSAPSLDASFQLGVIIKVVTWTETGTPFAACEILE